MNDEILLGAIQKLDEEGFEALSLKLLNEMGLEITRHRSKTGLVEAEGVANLPAGITKRYHIHIRQNSEDVSSKDIQKLVSRRIRDEAETLFITTGEYALNSSEYGKEMEVKMADGEHFVRLLEKYDLAADLLRPPGSETKKEEGEVEQFLPSVAELQDHMERGCEFFEMGKYKKAISHFDGALELKPKFADAWRMKARSLFELGADDNSLDTYKKALALDVKNPEMWFEFAEILYELGRHEEEIECYDQALVLNKNFSRAWNNKGATLFELNNVEIAIECFNKAVETSPGFDEAWHNMGLAYKKKGDYREALRAYYKALALDKKYLDARISLINLLNEMQRYEEASDQCHIALNQKRRDERLWYFAALAFKGLGHYNKSVKCAETALEIAPSSDVMRRLKADLVFLVDRYGDTVPAEPLWDRDWDDSGVNEPEDVEEGDVEEAPEAEPEGSDEMEPELEAEPEEKHETEGSEEEVSPSLDEEVQESEEEVPRSLDKEVQESEEEVPQSLDEDAHEESEGVPEIEPEEKLGAEPVKVEEPEPEHVEEPEEKLGAEPVKVEEPEQEVQESNEQVPTSLEHPPQESNEQEELEPTPELEPEPEHVEESEDEPAKIEEPEPEVEEEPEPEPEPAKIEEPEPEPVKVEEPEPEPEVEEEPEPEQEVIAPEDGRQHDEVFVPEKKVHAGYEFIPPGIETIDIVDEVKAEAVVEAKTKFVETEIPEPERKAGFNGFLHEIDNILQTATDKAAVEGDQADVDSELPGDFDGLVKTAKLLFMLGRSSKALEACEQALAIDEKDDNLWVLKGNALYHLGRIEGALEAYNNALRINPRSTVALLNREESFHKGRFVEEKSHASKRITELCPDLWQGWALRGCDHMDEGEYDAAIESLEQANALQNGLLLAQNMESLALMMEGDSEEALDRFTELVSSSASNPTAWNNRGIALYAREESDPVDAFERATKLFPGHALSWNNRGVALHKAGRIEDARDSLDTSILKDKEEPYALINRGLIVLEDGDAKSALDNFDNAVWLNDENAFAWYCKGKALAETDASDEEVKEAFSHAVTLAPDITLYQSSLGRSTRGRSKKGKGSKKKEPEAPIEELEERVPSSLDEDVQDSKEEVPPSLDENVQDSEEEVPPSLDENVQDLHEEDSEPDVEENVQDSDEQVPPPLDENVQEEHEAEQAPEEGEEEFSPYLDDDFQDEPEPEEEHEEEQGEEASEYDVAEDEGSAQEEEPEPGDEIDGHEDDDSLFEGLDEEEGEVLEPEIIEIDMDAGDKDDDMKSFNLGDILGQMSTAPPPPPEDSESACPRCGIELSGNETICPLCGSEL